MKLTWDEAAKRLYETGVDRVVLFPMTSTPATGSDYGTGVAWNGVTGITENPEGADANDIYADNMKYLSLISVENWKATIKAYTWPTEFNECQGEFEYDDGTTRGIYFGQQPHTKFALAWRTIVGNAVQGDSYGYKLHVAYGLTAAPSEKDHATVNDSPEATEFSWDLNSIPDAFTSIANSGLQPVSHIVVDSTLNLNGYKALEAALFGTDESAVGEGDDQDPYIPTPDGLITLVNI